MAPSNFYSLLICGLSGPLPNDHPLLSPSYNPCALCDMPTWRTCSKCGNVPYCSLWHESIDREVHSRACGIPQGHALPTDHPVLSPAYDPCAICEIPTWRRCSKCGNIPYCSSQHESVDRDVHSRICGMTCGRECIQRRTMIKPLRCYDVFRDEEMHWVASFHFNPNESVHTQLSIKYRPFGLWHDGQLVGPCPILGKYFTDAAPQGVLLELDSRRRLDEPFIVWYSEKAISSRRAANAAILSLFGPDEQPEHLWKGTVIVMKFANWDYRNFVPVTDTDLPCLKAYFSNFVGLDKI